MLSRFLSRPRFRRRAKEAAESYRRRIAALRSGDFSILDELSTEVRRSVLKESAETKPRSPAMEALLQATLKLIREHPRPDDSSDRTLSVSLPIFLLCGRIIGRSESGWRADFSGLCGGFTPAVGYLSGWLAQLAVGVAVALASIAPPSNPNTAFEAKSASASTNHAFEASLAPALDMEARDATERRASASVGLPNTGGQHESVYEVAAKVDRGPRKITIRRQEEVRVGNVLILKHEGTTEIYCDSSVREKLCDLYDQLPLPEAPED